MKNFKNNIDVLILVGGLGTRLKSVSNNVPKPLIKINNRPFLSILLEYVTSFNFNRIILCTGYKSSVFQKYAEQNKINYKIIISKESKPLGTAGAIKNAEKLIESKSFLVINGDSFCKLDYEKFCMFFKKNDPIAQIAVSRSTNAKNYASIKLDSNNNIIEYKEKQNICENTEKFISTGIYQFSSEIMNFIDGDKFVSLEFDIIPKLIRSLPKRIYSYKTKGEFIDIGTPKNYEKSQDILNNYN